ncbi:MAG: cadherin-like domain-containing protein, partial [Planctomycetales bacterium]|nr:cadherin-like domain-containing protein [Planctomycetales bacterium]
ITNLSDAVEDDEDGIRIVGAFNVNTDLTEIVIQASGTGLLDAWVDFNQNGVFTDPGEQIFAGRAVFAGENRLFASTPSTALLGGTYARFRLNTTALLAPLGSALGGEVEDLWVHVVDGEPPTVVDDHYMVAEDSTLSVSSAVGVLSNDTDDSPQSELRATRVRDVEHGTLVLQQDGSFTYTPDANYHGMDTFVYSASDPL